MDKPNMVMFYGNMDWFDVDDDANDVIFPQAFDQAKDLWNKDPVGNLPDILNLIAPFVRAWFVPAALSDSEDIFPDQSDFSATKIRVVGIDFRAKPFPLCKAEAWFEVPVSELFATTDIEERENDTGEYFYQAVSFGWEIPALNGQDTHVFTYGNHQGVECIPNADIGNPPLG